MSPALIRKPLHYDAAQRRVWIYGQRCHHGATGVVLAGAGAVGLVAARLKAPVGLAALATGSAYSALLATGSVLILHDWHDRAMWFQRGWQNQP